jgi:pimeloyl-ACP methyl ester carboxylesterase
MAEPRMSTVRSKDGTAIAYWRSGEGPPMLLVHASTSDHTRWDVVRPAFAEHFAVYAMDRRGRGGSGDGPTYAVDREFEDVAAVVDQAAQESGAPVQLVAHSYGALCSLEATRLTANVAKLVLYEPPVQPDPSMSPAFVAELEHLAAEGRREELLAQFQMVVLGHTAEDMERSRAQPQWPARVAAAHTVARETALGQSYRFIPDRFADLRIPVLLLQGTESPPFLQRSTAAVQAALPHSRIVLLNGQAHQAVGQATELFVREVLAFLL